MARNKKVASSLWADDQLDEKPNRKSGPVELSEKWIRIIRGYTKVSVWSFPLVAVLLIMTMDTGGEVVAPTVSTVNQVDSPGKAAAVIEMNEWMDAVPAPIRGGKIVSWNGYDSKTPPKIAESLEDEIRAVAYNVETHHFIVMDDTGNRYSSDVAVAVSADDGAVALGSPSLTPIAPPATGWASEGAWFDVVDATANEDVGPTVQEWAKAFTSGDPKTLRLYVGDPDSAHSYVPLTGVESYTAEPSDAAAIPVIEDGVIKAGDPEQIILRVTLQLLWKGAIALDDDGRPIPQDEHGDNTISYDVLVDKANTASPKIVAWGGAGSGTSLEPYSNAVINREIQAQKEGK